MLERIKRAKSLHAITIFDNVVYTAGLGANDIDADMEGQTAQICEKIDTLLAQAGTDKTRIIKAEIFVTDMKKKVDMDRAWLAWMPEEHLPCRATIGVADLGDPRRLIEVMITAAK
jgi:enamine deaminase RidA (YjgF/YER057c/UK114 family)